MSSPSKKSNRGNASQAKLVMKTISAKDLQSPSSSIVGPAKRRQERKLVLQSDSESSSEDEPKVKYDDDSDDLLEDVEEDAGEEGLPLPEGASSGLTSTET